MSIRKILSVISLCALLPLSGNAQEANDIFKLQQQSLYGSPRFMAMGGAFGAVGSEVSAIGINPAVGALAVKSEISVAFGPEWYDSSTDFYKTNTKMENDMKFTATQFGANFVFVNDNVYSSFGGIAIGVNYSRRYDFNNQIDFNGRNTTITDYLSGMPIGSSVVESLFRNAIDGTNGSAVGLATDLGVLDLVGDNIYPGAVYNDINQAASILTSGNSNVVTFAASVNISNRLYVGLGFDYVTIDVDQNNIRMDEWGYTRDNGLPYSGVSNLAYDRYTSQYGFGSNFNIGVIAKVTDQFRLGVSWKSRTKVDIEESYSYLMIAEFFDGSKSEGYKNPTDGGPNRYSFTSPSEFTFSGAYIFGRYGLISVDYMMKDYSHMKFSGSYFDEQNRIIKEQMKVSSTLRIGGELRLYPVSIRAGFNYITSPYKDLTVKRVSQTSSTVLEEFITVPQGTGDAMGVSFGGGYAIAKFLSVDLSYNYRSSTVYNYLYEPSLTSAAKTDLKQHNITLGISFRF